ncbi:MAG: ELWxxDGT repeat protein [Flavipsychrobacter sp.]
MKKPLLSALLTCILSSAFAQYSFINFDINPSGNSNPHDLVNFNGRLYFAATTDSTGDELWVSDGTAAGTKLVADIDTGAGSSTPHRFTELNGKLLFFANPYKLYSTDGTTAGTVLLANTLGYTYISGYPPTIARLGNKLYFAAGVASNELWVTDGTVSGTYKITTFAAHSTPSSISSISVCYGKLYIGAPTSHYDRGLWISDGTASGTVLLKDMNGDNIIDPSMFTEYKNKVYFIAYSIAGGYDLWAADSTGAGPKQITHIASRTRGLAPAYHPVKIYNNEMYFNGWCGMCVTVDNPPGLYKSDGTDTGTVVVHQLYNNYIDNKNLITTNIEYNNKLYFTVQNFDSSGLWYTNGTEDATVDITSNIWPKSIPHRLSKYNNKLFFSAYAAPWEYELFCSDGTTAGTKVLHPPGAKKNALQDASVFYGAVESNGLLFFMAEYTNTGFELWALKDSSLSIGNNAQPLPAAITLYPNPANHNFTIKTTTVFKTGSVTLTDVTGHVVKTEKLYSNEQTISLQGISSGMYIADVWLDGKRSTQKLIIK